jgi:iron complex transport system ATP-binding protein
MTDGRLRAGGITLGYGAREVVHELDLDVPAGATTAIVGGNGCGKSTLLRALARLLRPSGGTVMLDGRAIADWPTTAVARRVGILPQGPQAPDGLTVEDLVARGRYPHQSLMRQWSAEDADAVERALAATRVGALRDRPLDELSGGQRQRAWIAMTLAQDTPTVLLDEPTTFLDLAHQIEVLDLLADLVASHGRTVVMVLHDLNQACRYADHLVAMREGRVHATGTPAEIVDAALIRAVFGLEARVVADPVTGTPMCVPAGPRRPARPRPAPDHPALEVS